MDLARGKAIELGVGRLFGLKNVWNVLNALTEETSIEKTTIFILSCNSAATLEKLYLCDMFEL